MTAPRDSLALASNPGPTRVIKALAQVLPEASEFVALKFGLEEGSSSYEVKFRYGGRAETVIFIPMSEQGRTITCVIHNRKEGAPDVLDALERCFDTLVAGELEAKLHAGETADEIRAASETVLLTPEETFLSNIEPDLSAEDAIALRRMVMKQSTLDLLAARLDDLMVPSGRPAREGSADEVVDGIEEAMGDATGGRFMAVSGRLLKLPTWGADFAVVDPVSKVEIGRIAKSGDARWIAATSPEKVDILVREYRRLSNVDTRSRQIDYVALVRVRELERQVRTLEATIQTLLADPKTVTAAQLDVHENWKLVPVEPTPEMITAGDNAGARAWHTREHMATAITRAAIAAAPTPPDVTAPKTVVDPDPELVDVGLPCLRCGSTDGMKPFTDDKPALQHKGLSVEVDSLSGYRCSDCGEFEFDEKSAEQYAAAGDALVRQARERGS